jgi:hypothetical protein
MAVIRSGASSTDLTVDTASLAARVAIYDTAGNALGARVTYMASNVLALGTPANPTDMLWIGGSATRTIRVFSFYISPTTTVAGSEAYLLVKRSTADTGGTATTTTGVQLDSGDGNATAIVTHYVSGANPTLGSTVGTIATIRIGSPVPIPTTWGGITPNPGYDMLAALLVGMPGGTRAVVLRGTAQQLCLNFAAAAVPAGLSLAFNILWTEEV